VTLVSATPQQLRIRAARSIRRVVGLNQSPLPPCNDRTEAYFPIDGVARVVHGDLASMLVGGLGSLFLQMLHPHSMAGVAQHSRYKDDPRGRLLQTANFIGRTTYGSKSTAYAQIERVLAVHEGVRGIADDGEPYYANDPHLLAWVHACEVSMFLRAYQNFGKYRITLKDANDYVNEMATLARDLGAQDPPTSVSQLERQIDTYRGELRLTRDGVTARDWVIRGFLETRQQRLVYRQLVRSSFALMEPWSRDLLGVRSSPVRNRLFTRPATKFASGLVHVAVPPPGRVRTPG
jgi:uncharacterized protein (DUF2236 family)